MHAIELDSLAYYFFLPIGQNPNVELFLHILSGSRADLEAQGLAANKEANGFRQRRDIVLWNKKPSFPTIDVFRKAVVNCCNNGKTCRLRFLQR